MTRKRLSTTERVKCFDAASGICHLCNRKIQAGEAWDVSHVIPLAVGGEDEPDNRRPAHRKCHRTHTAETDQPWIAKTKRQRAKHIGAKVSSRPMPHGRNSPTKRTMDRRVVDRRTGEVIR